MDVVNVLLDEIMRLVETCECVELVAFENRKRVARITIAGDTLQVDWSLKLSGIDAKFAAAQAQSRFSYTASEFATIHEYSGVKGAPLKELLLSVVLPPVVAQYGLMNVTVRTVCRRATAAYVVHVDGTVVTAEDHAKRQEEERVKHALKVQKETAERAAYESHPTVSMGGGPQVPDSDSDSDSEVDDATEKEKEKGTETDSDDWNANNETVKDITEVLADIQRIADKVDRMATAHDEDTASVKRVISEANENASARRMVAEAVPVHIQFAETVPVPVLFADDVFQRVAQAADAVWRNTREMGEADAHAHIELIHVHTAPGPERERACADVKADLERLLVAANIVRDKTRDAYHRYHEACAKAK
jgi:hypothetical protein